MAPLGGVHVVPRDKAFNRSEPGGGGGEGVRPRRGQRQDGCWP